VASLADVKRILLVIRERLTKTPILLGDKIPEEESLGLIISRIYGGELFTPPPQNIILRYWNKFTRTDQHDIHFEVGEDYLIISGQVFGSAEVWLDVRNTPLHGKSGRLVTGAMISVDGWASITLNNELFLGFSRITFSNMEYIRFDFLTFGAFRMKIHDVEFIDEGGA